MGRALTVSRDRGSAEGCQDSRAAISRVLAFYEKLGIEYYPLRISSGREQSHAHGDADRAEALAHLKAEIGDCVRCSLSQNRSQIVFGSGNPSARLMFIGEAPGREEDLQGLPFVGDAGAVLTRLIEKMGLTRDAVYIANIVKCRPPMNRDPEDEEIAACRPFLERQIAIIQPEVIMTLGRIALRVLKGTAQVRITAERGKSFLFMGIPVVPTFHPAYLLRNPADKWLTWSDAQQVIEKLGR